MKCRTDCKWYELEGEIPRCYHPDNRWVTIGMDAFHERPRPQWGDCFAEYVKEGE
jgi:hypothetical protein